MTDMRARVQRIISRAKSKQPGPLADRMVDVVELVNWVYAVQKAHIVDGRGVGLHENEMIAEGLLPARDAGSGSTFAAFEAIQRLGVRIERQGYNMGELHPVAEIVHDLVTGMVSEDGTLIVRYAAKAAIPRGATFDVKLGPVWKGDPRYMHQACGDCCKGELRALPAPGSFRIMVDSGKRPVFCPLEFDHGSDFLAKLRAEYIGWHDALTLLVEGCRVRRDRLGGLIVTGPKLQREPWLGAGGHSRVKAAL